jgi:hypothetical protein
MWRTTALSLAPPPVEYTRADGTTSCDVACRWDVDFVASGKCTYMKTQTSAVPVVDYAPLTGTTAF